VFDGLSDETAAASDENGLRHGSERARVVK
jgi:hypothetical protein